ncbi:Pycsar system effector family protein [Halalkalibaculum sp. DA3122]|uniref:Pycsar system effector family protein n=1 Tax=unclassified Halalkalibaculum TaxID=2964617 RepID=UPI0037540585
MEQSTEPTKEQEERTGSEPEEQPKNGEQEKEAEEEKKFGSRKRGVSDMFRTAYRTHVELSAIADNKSNIMISINGIIISIVIASISPKIDANPWLLWPTAALLIFCLASLVFAILAARPRVNKNPVTLEDVRENRANILFFGNYNNMERSEFVEGIEELMQDEQRLYDSMARDLYGLGQVLFKKYDLLKVSYTIFMAGIVLAVVLFITVFLTVA